MCKQQPDDSFCYQRSQMNVRQREQDYCVDVGFADHFDTRTLSSKPSERRPTLRQAKPSP